MNGFNVAEAGHVINMLPAVSVSGGKTTLPISMANAEHLSIIINFGAVAAPPTSIIVRQATTEGIAASSPISFRFYVQTTAAAGHDTLAGPYYADTTGITSTLPTTAPFPATTGATGLVWVIEIDSAELEAVAATVGTITEYPYVYVVIADTGNTSIVSVTGILSGLRYAYKGSPTVTT